MNSFCWDCPPSNSVPFHDRLCSVHASWSAAHLLIPCLMALTKTLATLGLRTSHPSIGATSISRMLSRVRMGVIGFGEGATTTGGGGCTVARMRLDMTVVCSLSDMGSGGAVDFVLRLRDGGDDDNVCLRDAGDCTGDKVLLRDGVGDKV